MSLYKSSKQTKQQNNNNMLVKRLSERAILPVRGSKLAAGLDLSAADGATVPAGGKVLIPTDWMMAIPEGFYGRIAPRSGLSWKFFIDTGAGVIDSGKLHFSSSKGLTELFC
jgi:dUTP pyrophosphatase